MGTPYLVLATFCGCMYWKVRRARAARALQGKSTTNTSAAPNIAENPHTEISHVESPAVRRIERASRSRSASRIGWVSSAADCSSLPVSARGLAHLSLFRQRSAAVQAVAQRASVSPRVGRRGRPTLGSR